MKDIDFERSEIVVREGKGNKDRVTMLPRRLHVLLRAQIAKARAMYEADLALGQGEVWLPDALAVKNPKAPKSGVWQYVFPAAGFSADPRSGVVRRHHTDEKRMHRAVKAAERVGIAKPVSPHTLRHSVAIHPSAKRLRHSNRAGTPGPLRRVHDYVYTHVLNRGGHGVWSPLDAG